MKYVVGFTVTLLLAGLCPLAVLAQKAMPGGYATASVTNKEVQAAAAFAIDTQHKLMQEKNDPEGARLELVTILKAEQQVVAGLNYRLLLKVKLDGKERMAEAIVWWQPWRKPDSYKLTSWAWK